MDNNIYENLETIIMQIRSAGEYATVLPSLIVSGVTRSGFPLLCIEPISTKYKQVASGVQVPFKYLYAISSFTLANEKNMITGGKDNVHKLERAFAEIKSTPIDDVVNTQTIIAKEKCHCAFAIFETPAIQ